MPNPRSGNGFPSGGRPKKSKGSGHAGTEPMKTANWPGAPGKKQSRDRSAGFGKKIPQSVKQDF